MPATKIGPTATDDLQLLRACATEAGRIALRYFKRDPQVWMKNGTSPVSEADYAVDRYLRDTLLAARPEYGWLSEETSDDLSRLNAQRLFVVDPIDGTRGFLEGGDRWCVSVAVVENGRSLAGVLECPARQEQYWAESGRGSYLDGERLATIPLGASLRLGGPKPLIDLFDKAWRGEVTRVAYVPSLAYRIAMIAAGKLDATFVKPNAHDWDLAAADLILAEAGGLIEDAAGEYPRYGKENTAHGALAAGGREIVETMRGVLAHS